jgi:hypothetical protein
MTLIATLEMSWDEENILTSQTITETGLVIILRPLRISLPREFYEDKQFENFSFPLWVLELKMTTMQVKLIFVQLYRSSNKSLSMV